MADRARAQIQAKSQCMTVSQRQVVVQGHTMAEVRASVLLEGVTARVEAMVAEWGGVGRTEVRSTLKKVEVDVGVEWLVVYMAANVVDVWAVGGTYEWERGSRDGYGAGPLDAGVFFQGEWMMTQSEIYASDGNYDTG